MSTFQNNWALRFGAGFLFCLLKEPFNLNTHLILKAFVLKYGKLDLLFIIQLSRIALNAEQMRTFLCPRHMFLCLIYIFSI